MTPIKEALSESWGYPAQSWGGIRFEGPIEVDRQALRVLYGDALSDWNRLLPLNLFVPGSWPRLWFGDLEAYEKSRVRVVTASINPSGKDFTSKRNETAVQLAKKCRDEDLASYLEFSKSFFRTGSPDAWFGGYRRVLRHIRTPVMSGVDYGCSGPWSNTGTFPELPANAGVALHTDVCSPFSTKEVWSKLGKSDQELLCESGKPLFSRLIKLLRPNFVLLSVNRAHWPSESKFGHRSADIVVFRYGEGLAVAGGAGRSGPYVGRGWNVTKKEELGAWMGSEATKREPAELIGLEPDDYADFGLNSTPWMDESNPAHEYDVFEDNEG